MSTRMLSPMDWDNQLALLNRKRIRSQQKTLKPNEVFGLKSLNINNKARLLKLIEAYNNAYTFFPVPISDFQIIKPVADANKNARATLQTGNLKKCVLEIKTLHQSSEYRHAQACLLTVDFINKRHSELLSEQTWTLLANGKKSQKNITIGDLHKIKSYWMKHARFSNFTSPALVYVSDKIFPILYQELTNALYELKQKQKSIPHDIYQNYQLWLNNSIKTLEQHKKELISSMLVRLQTASNQNDLEYDDITWQMMSFLNHKIMDNPCQLPKPRKTLTSESFNYFHQYILTYGSYEDKQSLMKLRWFSNKNSKEHQKLANDYLCTASQPEHNDPNKKTKVLWLKKKLNFLTHIYDDSSYQKKFLQKRFYTLACFNSVIPKTSLNHLNLFKKQTSIKLLSICEAVLADEYKMLKLESQQNTILNSGLKKSKRADFLKKWKYFLDTQRSNQVDYKINVLREIINEYELKKIENPLFTIQLDDKTKIEIEKFIVDCLQDILTIPINKKSSLAYQKYITEINQLLTKLSIAQLFNNGRLSLKLPTELKELINLNPSNQAEDFEKLFQQLSLGHHLREYQIEYLFDYIESATLLHTPDLQLKENFKTLTQPILETALSKIQYALKKNKTLPLNHQGMEEYCHEILYWATIIDKLCLYAHDYQLDFDSSHLKPLRKLLAKFIISQRTFVQNTLIKNDLTNPSLICVEQIISLLKVQSIKTPVEKLIQLRKNEPSTDDVSKAYLEIYNDLTNKTSIWLLQLRFHKEFSIFNDNLLETIKNDPTYKKYFKDNTSSLIFETRDKMIKSHETDVHVFAEKSITPLPENEKTLLGFYPTQPLGFIKTWLKLTTTAHLAKNNFEKVSCKRKPSLEQLDAIVCQLNTSITNTSLDAENAHSTMITPAMKSLTLNRFNQSRFFNKHYSVKDDQALEVSLNSTQGR